MPLDKLSNMEKDYFVLDRGSEIFSLKPVIHDFWNNEKYKELVKERVDFLLTRYFQRKGLRQIVYYQTILPFIFGHFLVTLAGHFCGLGFVLIVKL
jgi:hypothetical protein